MGSCEVLELLAARGWDCRALTCGVLDYQRETAMEEVLDTMGLTLARATAALTRRGSAEVVNLEPRGVHVTVRDSDTRGFRHP